MATLNTDTSVIDYLKSTGGDASFSSRAKKAVELGIVQSTAQYTGSSQQNTSLLTKLRSGTPTAPTQVNNQNDATKFINASQDDDIVKASKSDEPPVRNAAQDLVTAFKDITGKDSLVPSVPLPSAPDFEQTYYNLRQQYGVQGLETSINEYDALEQDIQARLRERVDIEEGKPVAMNVIEGRVGETEKQEFRRLDEIGRAKQRAVNQLQSANDAIENIMTFRKMDYDVASDRYDKEFAQNLQLFNVIQGVAEFASSERRADENSARANLQIIYNSIQDGNTDVATVDDATKTKISKLELQAGLPQGFYQNIQAEKPDAKVLSTTTRVASGAKYADVLYQNPDGSLTTQSVYIGASGSGTGGGTGAPAVSLEEYISAAEQELQMSLDPSGFLYKDLEAQWKSDYPSTTGIGFTDSELKKLEQAGLLGSSRQEQLDYLYGDDGGDDDNPWG